MSNIFGLTYADLKAKLNRTDQPHLFMGSSSEISSTQVQAALDVQADYVESRLPERYRQLLRRVDGEIVVKYATAGQTTATLGLSGATNIKLYKNYPAAFLSINPDVQLPRRYLEDNAYRLWSDRNPSYEMDDDEWENSSGTITFSPALSAGDTIVAEYDHTACTSCELLKLMVLRLAAVEFGRELYDVSADVLRDVYEPWERQVHIDFGRMYNNQDQGRLGIKMFDQLVLMEETRGRNNTRRTPALGGW